MSNIVQKMISVTTNSSMIEEMVYDRSTFTLTVKFRKGGLYQYDGVSENLFNSMISQDNDSIGKYFHAYIRKFPITYPYTRLS